MKDGELPSDQPKSSETQPPPPPLPQSTMLKRKTSEDRDNKLIPPKIRKSTDGLIDTSNLRKSKRIPKSCYQCYKRKVKCNFEVPCNVCIDRNRGHLCTKEPIIVDGLIVNSSNNNEELKFSKENEVLKTKIKDLEQRVEALKKDKAQLESINDLVLKNSIESAAIMENEFVMNPANKSRTQFGSSSIDSPQSSSPPSPPDFPSDGNNEPWEGYSLTLDLLNKGIGVGLDDQNLNYNTEEWLRLGKLNVDSSVKRSLMLNSKSKESTIWNYWLEIIHMIGKRESDIMMNSALDSWFLHNVVDKDKVWKQYNEYWAQDLDDEKERHITAHYSKSKEEYLWMGQWYSLLCIGIFYSNDSVQIELGFTMDQWEAFPRVFFSSALECLYRGGFMTYYRIESIQLYCLLKLCAHALGGITLHNCLLSTNIYIARKLNLDKLTPDDEATDPDYDIKRRVWWYLVQSDWNENKGRYSLVDIDSYSTPLPEIWKVKKKEVDWNEYYQRFSIHLGKIKKQYYYEDEVKQEELNLKTLTIANLELQALQKEVENDFDLYPDHRLLEIDHLYKTKVEFSQFIIEIMIAYEILEVNSKMSSYMSRDLWISRCHSICVKCALFIINQYISTEVNTQFKMPWFIPNHAISAGVFLLVDHMLNQQNNADHLRTINLVKSVIPSLGLYRLVMRPAARGIYIIQKLIELLVKKDNLAELKKMSFSDIEAMKLKSRLSKTKMNRSSSFHGEGDDEEENNSISRFKLNLSGAYTPPLTVKERRRLTGPPNAKSQDVLSDGIISGANRGSNNNFILNHAPVLRLGTDSPDAPSSSRSHSSIYTPNEEESKRKIRKLESESPSVSKNLYEDRDLGQRTFHTNAISMTNSSNVGVNATGSTPAAYAQSYFNSPTNQIRARQEQHQQFMQAQSQLRQQQLQQQQQQQQEIQQSSQQPLQSESGQPFYTRILDILGNTGWDEFINSIDDFNMALDV